MADQKKQKGSLRIRVGAVCFENSSILLVEHEKNGERYWLLPGGGMNEGERAEAALEREVLEETAVQSSVGRLVCVCESLSPDKTRHIVHFLYEVTRLKGSPGISTDPRVRRSAFVPISNLSHLTMYPPLQSWIEQCFREGFGTSPAYLGAMPWI